MFSAMRRFREKLDAGHFCLGAGISFTDPAVTEALCDSVDFVWIDLEHNICYSPSNNWNALCDGKVKYVFHAEDGGEQLFDLALDPGEMNDLAGDAAHGDEASVG